MKDPCVSRHSAAQALSVQVLQAFYAQATRGTRPDALAHDIAVGLIPHRIFSHVLKPNRINHFEKRELIEVSIPGADLSNSVLAKQNHCVGVVE